MIGVALLLLPASASAHVNRTVGPYTIFMVMIEEPYFATNHAGFEFWVHAGDRPIPGLDATLAAQAIRGPDAVDLLVSPMNDRGFYDVDTDAAGRAFDPGSGGAWTLRLTGTIEGRAVDESLDTRFPVYPRVGRSAAAPIVDGGAGSVAFPPIAAVGRPRRHRHGGHRDHRRPTTTAAAARRRIWDVGGEPPERIADRTGRSPPATGRDLRLASGYGRRLDLRHRWTAGR